VIRLVVVVVVLGALLGAGRALVAGDDVHVSARPDTAAAADAASCRRASAPVRVRLSRRRWPHIADHVTDVRQRYPLVLHLDRRHADAHRDASLRGVRTREGQDRDEFPPAVAKEGGRGADIRLVPSSENRSSGAYVGNKLRRWCDGQGFVIRVRR
jgi:hypothetical protein